LEEMNGREICVFGFEGIINTFVSNL